MVPMAAATYDVADPVDILVLIGEVATAGPKDVTATSATTEHCLLL